MAKALAGDWGEWGIIDAEPVQWEIMGIIDLTKQSQDENEVGRQAGVSVRRLRRSRIRAAASFEDSDDLLGELSEIEQRWNDRLTINNLSLAERYLKGELRLVACLQVGNGTDKQLRAILQGIFPIGGLNRDAGHDLLYVGPFWRQLKPNRDVLVGRPYRHDSLVFIQSVKLMDEPERFAPSFIWLEFVDDASDLSSNALYLSRRVGFKRLAVIADGEAGALCDLPMVDHDKLAHQIVQGRAKVMRDIPDDGAQGGGYAFDDADTVDVASSLRIVIADDHIWIALVESADLRFKLTDVAFGPFDL